LQGELTLGRILLLNLAIVAEWFAILTGLTINLIDWITAAAQFSECQACGNV